MSRSLLGGRGEPTVWAKIVMVILLMSYFKYCSANDSFDVISTLLSRVSYPRSYESPPSPCWSLRPSKGTWLHVEVADPGPWWRSLRTSMPRRCWHWWCCSWRCWCESHPTREILGWHTLESKSAGRTITSASNRVPARHTATRLFQDPGENVAGLNRDPAPVPPRD